MEASNTRRNLSFDVLRIIACFLVVMVHVSANLMDSYPVQSFSFQFALFSNMISISAPAIFFALSGALFLNPGFEKADPKRLWSKYILRLVLSYIVWSFFYTFVFCIPYYSLSLETAREFISAFFFGAPMYHMWFIPVIIAIYAILPLLRPAFAREENCRYFLILFVILSIVLPTLFHFSFPLKNHMHALYSRFPIPDILGYIGYFVLGHYLSTAVFGRRFRMAVYICCLASLAAAICTACRLSALWGEPVLFLNGIFSLNTCLMVSAVFLLIRHIPLSVGKADRLIEKVARYTFGIYMLHPMLLKLCLERCSIVADLPSVVAIPLITAGVFASSMAVIGIVSRIPVMGRYLT